MDKTPLPGSARASAPGARVVGEVDSAERLLLTLVIRPKQALEDSTLASPEYPGGKQLTRERFADLFGASDDDIARVRQWAEANRFEVAETNPAERTVKIAGTTGDLARAFGIDLKLFESPQETYRGRSGEIQVPTEIADAVTGVFGFDNRRQARPHLVLRPPHTAVMRAASAAVAFTPPQIANLYNFPAGLDGTGQCIGIIEFGGGFLPEDLDAYFSALGFATPAVTAVSVDGVDNAPAAPDADGNTPDGEVMLDIEVAGAVAPKANIAVYFAPFTEQGWVDVIRRAVHDDVNKPSVISISWGWPEGQDLWTQQALTAVNDALREAAALGVTVCCASGDDGSADEIADGKAHVDFPAASPYVLSCGGTTLFTSGAALVWESVWNNGPRSMPGGGASGGGVSAFFPLPDYQASAGVPRSAATGQSGRGVPDIAGDADPNSGYIVRVRGSRSVAGGTSAVAPLVAGLIARVNQQLGSSVGFVNPVLYTRLAALGVCRDVIWGSNDTTGLTGGYPARAGWDAATGWGSIDGTAFLNALSNVTPPPPPGPSVGTRWDTAPGAAYDVGADGDVIWAVGTIPAGPTGLGIFRWNGSGWDSIPGAATRIAVAPDGSPVIVNGRGEIYRGGVDGGWNPLPGFAHDVAVGGDGTVWVISTIPMGNGFAIYYWSGQAWTLVPGAAVRIAAGPDGSAWIVDYWGRVAHWSGAAWEMVPAPSTNAGLPGIARDIAVGRNGAVWFATSPAANGSGIFHWNGASWDAVAGSGVALAVTSNGLPWVIDAESRIQVRA